MKHQKKWTLEDFRTVVPTWLKYDSVNFIRCWLPWRAAYYRGRCEAWEKLINCLDIAIADNTRIDSERSALGEKASDL